MKKSLISAKSWLGVMLFLAMTGIANATDVDFQTVASSASTTINDALGAAAPIIIAIVATICGVLLVMSMLKKGAK